MIKSVGALLVIGKQQQAAMQHAFYHLPDLLLRPDVFFSVLMS